MASGTLSSSPHRAIISLTKPFTPATLNTLRHALRKASDFKGPTNPLNWHGASKERNAAVLIPLCNVGDKPGILLEVRSKNLRTHSGEISFPGGRIDDTDEFLINGALRETREELGINLNQVEVLGSIGPPEFSLRGDMRVWPFVGFVHTEGSKALAEDDALPSLHIEEIRMQASPSEVATVIHLPLERFSSTTRLRTSMFRGRQQYWAVDVTDLVPSYHAEDTITIQKGESVDEVGSGVNGRIEVWGLTGWYLSLLMKVIQTYQ